MSGPDALTADIATFEAVWLYRLHGLAGEISAAVKLVAALSADKPTVRAIAHGEPAARAEILRAYLRLPGFIRRYRAEFDPAPHRFEPLAQLVGRAFESLAAAAVAFEAASGPVVDFDGLAIAGEHLAEAARCMSLAVPGPHDVQEPTAPPPVKKPRRRGDAILND
jgi:hypothetical protein